MMDGKDVEKRESSYTVGGNVTWCSHCGEQYGDFLKELIIELAYYTAIPVLSIYPDQNRIQRDTNTTMLIAALFTKAKTWKQPKYPLTDEWIRKMRCIYSLEN